MMTERMQEYRKRMKEKGLVQVRIWVEEQDENFVKYIAKFFREVREKKEKKRYGRRASKQKIDFAKALAKSKNVPEPNHLYDHHNSPLDKLWGLIYMYIIGGCLLCLPFDYHQKLKTVLLILLQKQDAQRPTMLEKLSLI